MKYQQPVGAAENAPYVGRSLAAGGSTGSRPPAAAIEHPQREIENTIKAAGLTPSSADLTQLAQAAKLLAKQAVDRVAISPVAPSSDTRYVPGATLPAGSFTRASTATWYDVFGVLQSAANDVARFTADPATGVNLGLLIEGSRTNYLLNSAAPATQTVSLAAGTYCLWIDGAGSVTLAGDAIGVATQGVPVVFTLAAAGSVTATVAGSVTRFQLGNGSYPSSFIATAGAAATRAADIYSESAAGWFNPAEGAIYLSLWWDGLGKGQRLWSISDGTINNSLDVARQSSGSFNLALTLAGATVFNVASGVQPAAGVNRIVLSYGPAGTVLTLNGTAIATAAAPPSLTALTTFKYGRANNANQPDLPILRRACFPRALSDDVAKRMTAP